jgi:hypothetical protein
LYEEEGEIEVVAIDWTGTVMLERELAGFALGFEIRR